MQHTILVVDDDINIRLLLRTVLEDSGYTVVDTASGKEAIRIAHEQSIDLIITDLIMPEIEGIELIRYFRASMPSVKIIAISGASFNQYLQMAKALGADAVHSKPFRIEVLLATVARLISTQ